MFNFTFVYDREQKCFPIIVCQMVVLTPVIIEFKNDNSLKGNELFKL